jgi:5'-nucleotidase
VLGYINVAFEAGSGGRVLAYEGGPITMDSSTPQQPEFQAKVDAWRAPFDSYSKEVVGWTEGVLDQTMCQRGECESACFGSTLRLMVIPIFNRHTWELDY